MDMTLKMATFPRHGHLVTGFCPYIIDLFKMGKLYYLSEEQLLAFRGKKFSGEEELINANEDVFNEKFVSEGIDLLDCVQPDFLFFMKNKFIQTKNTLRTIGVPDLVVEVWSAGNEFPEREMKFRLYSSSPLCEHWYLEQDSNDVQVFKGFNKLGAQNLKNILITTDGIEFDLRYLAL